MLKRVFAREKMLLCGLLVCYLALPTEASETRSVQVEFGNSCALDVQAKFTHGVALLHSFEYPEASTVFRGIIERDPDCAMAHWGAAMTLWHPLWAPPSEEDLRKGAGILAKAAQLEATPRESAYIDALRAFFSSEDPGTHQTRARAHEMGMESVYKTHVEDPEAAIFYALALLATADPRDKSYAHQFKAAALLNWVRDSHPRHPGVLHYLIHSYDYPGLAHLGLEAAKIYADAAPDSAHAQHMPSHIFTRLGLWERSLSSNHDSMRSAADYTQRAQLPGHYDEGLHSMDYLMYALLQTARDGEAKALLDRLHRVGKTHPENFKVAYTFASSPARFALERRQWTEASELVLEPVDFPWHEFGWAQSIHHFARGIGAARSGQAGRARKELEAIRGLQSQLPSTTLPYWSEEVQVHIDAVTSWILLTEGREIEALTLASQAADREDAVDKHPVTPGEVLPARELYADMLLEASRYAESLEQYQIVLTGSPNRLNALLGGARAAAHSDRLDLLEQYRTIISEQTRSGNPHRTGLKSALGSPQ